MSLELSLEQLNRLYLRSHFLLDNAQPADLVEVIGEICGLNAQTARAPYVSLWSRVGGFQKGQLVRALYEDKILVKTWFMRGTVHIVLARDFAVYQKALSRSLVEGWERWLSRQGLMLPARTRTKLHQKIIDALSPAPRTKRALFPEIRHLLKGHAEREQKRHLSWALRELSYRGLVCHGEPTGPWYHFKEHRFATVEHWLPEINLEELDEEGARRELLLKYLHGYGPASVQDFAYWTGFKVSDSRPIFEGVRTKLAEVKIRDGKGSLWMLKADVARLDDIDFKQKPPVRFLPEFDPLIMGHRDKSRIMDDLYRKQVFLPRADVAPIILMGGRVAGTWNFKMTTHSLNTALFNPISSKERKEFEAESVRSRHFLGSSDISSFRADKDGV